MSEGAHRRLSVAALPLRLSDERRPGLLYAAGPARADEGGAADAVADSKAVRFHGRYRFS